MLPQEILLKIAEDVLHNCDGWASYIDFINMAIAINLISENELCPFYEAVHSLFPHLNQGTSP
jgi:hypothetical protein